MTGAELFLGGVAALAVLSMVVKARAGVKRARAAAEIARVGASPVSVMGRVLMTAGVIVGVQWLVITYAAGNTTLLLAVLAAPALVAAFGSRRWAIRRSGPARTNPTGNWPPGCVPGAQCGRSAWSWSFGSAVSRQSACGAR